MEPSRRVQPCLACRLRLARWLPCRWPRKGTSGCRARNRCCQCLAARERRPPIRYRIRARGRDTYRAADRLDRRRARRTEGAARSSRQGIHQPRCPGPRGRRGARERGSLEEGCGRDGERIADILAQCRRHCRCAAARRAGAAARCSGSGARRGGACRPGRCAGARPVAYPHTCNGRHRSDSSGGTFAATRAPGHDRGDRSSAVAGRAAC